MIEISTSRLQYNPKTRTLIGYSRDLCLVPRFPAELRVRSHHTGRVTTFVQDTEKAMQNEYWDGEECHYFSPEVPGVSLALLQQ